MTENKLQPTTPGALQTDTPNTTFNLPGDGHTLVAHTDVINNSYHFLMMNPQRPTAGMPAANAQVKFNPDFYHLIVVSDDDLDGTKPFIVRKDRAITESTSTELKAAYASLTPVAIAEIKSFPAIIATENHQYGKTDAEHFAVYGLITDIKVQDNGIKIYYQVLNWIPQQQLNELAYELGLGSASNFNELNRMHWAIKKINAVEVLREAGISIFTM